MFSKFFKKYSWLEILFTLTVLLGSMAIFASDTTLNPYLKSSNMLRVAFSYLIIFYLVVSVIRRPVIPTQMEYMGIIFLWWFISVFHVAPGVSAKLNILLMLQLFVYGYFRKEEQLRVFELYRYYILVMCCGGILAYLFYLLNIPFPCKVVPYYTGTEIQRHIYSWGDYYNYYIGFINVAGPFARLCGWFNEPGYLGTIGSLILIADNVNLRKKGNIIILVAMVFTFSLAAFVIIGGYLVTMALRKGKMVIALLVFIIAITTIVPIVFKDDPNYQHFTERLQFEDGEFVGDNRTSSNIFKRLSKKQFEDPQAALFGYGSGALQKYGDLGILGLEVQLYLYGIVGILLTYGLMFWLAWKLARGSYQAKCFVLWFFFSTYQRPYIFVGDYMLILFGGLALIKTKEENKKSKLSVTEPEPKEVEDLKSFVK